MSISSDAGLLENALQVNVLSVQSHTDVVIKDNNNGSCIVEYSAAVLVIIRGFDIFPRPPVSREHVQDKCGQTCTQPKLQIHLHCRLPSSYLWTQKRAVTVYYVYIYRLVLIYTLLDLMHAGPSGCGSQRG